MRLVDTVILGMLFALLIAPAWEDEGNDAPCTQLIEVRHIYTREVVDRPYTGP